MRIRSAHGTAWYQNNTNLVTAASHRVHTPSVGVVPLTGANIIMGRYQHQSAGLIGIGRGQRNATHHSPQRQDIALPLSIPVHTLNSMDGSMNNGCNKYRSGCNMQHPEAFSSLVAPQTGPNAYTEMALCDKTPAFMNILNL